MSFGQRQMHHSTQYNGGCLNRQIPSLIPNSYQGNKMQSNRKEVNDVRSMPPLIPVKHTPPSLSHIPQQTGGKGPHNNTAHYNSLQSQPKSNMALPVVGANSFPNGYGTARGVFNHSHTQSNLMGANSMHRNNGTTRGVSNNSPPQSNVMGANSEHRDNGTTRWVSNNSPPQSNGRKRKSENSNREVIDSIKLQLQQLNRTLEVLEKNSHSDDDEMLHGQLTPPRNDMSDFPQDNPLYQQHTSPTASLRNQTHSFVSNKDAKLHIDIPQFSYKDTLTPPESECSGSSVDYGTYTGYESKKSRTSPLTYRNEEEQGMIKEYHGSSHYNGNANGPNIYSNQLGSHPFDPKEMSHENKVGSATSKKLTSICQVCGDQAPEHIHYGSVSCFSCRAFFRRSVSKSNSYVCPGNRQCSIVVTTRKNCQYCRYQACLRAGMRPTWVLTDKEKKDRTKNKAQDSETTNTLQRQYVKCCTFGTRIKSSNSENDVFSNVCSMTFGDDRDIEGLLSEQSKTVGNEVFGKMVAHAIMKCIQTVKPDAVRLPRWATLEIFRVQYTRFSRLAMLISDFKSLSGRTQKLLLRSNLEAISMIRLSYFFKPRMGSCTTNLRPYVVAKTPLTSQLCEMGFEEKMAHEIVEHVTNEQDSSLTLEQIFPKEWTTDLTHLMLHRNVFEMLHQLITLDSTMVLLFQIINLFNSSGLSSDLNPAELKIIDLFQEKWTTQLLRYIKFKYGSSTALEILPKAILLLVELRLLSDKNNFNRE